MTDFAVVPREAVEYRDGELRAREHSVLEAAQRWRETWQKYCDTWPAKKGFEDTRACYELAAALDAFQESS